MSVCTVWSGVTLAYILEIMVENNAEITRQTGIKVAKVGNRLLRMLFAVFKSLLLQCYF